MTTKREIRSEARNSVYALLDANLDAADGDLFVSAEEFDEDEMGVFVDEIHRIMRRIWPA